MIRTVALVMAVAASLLSSAAFAKNDAPETIGDGSKVRSAAPDRFEVGLSWTERHADTIDKLAQVAARSLGKPGPMRKVVRDGVVAFPVDSQTPRRHVIKRVPRLVLSSWSPVGEGAFQD